MGEMQSPVTTYGPGVQSGLWASGLGQLYHRVGQESRGSELRGWGFGTGTCKRGSRSKTRDHGTNSVGVSEVA